MCARERERCRKRVRSDFSVSRKEERRGSPHASPCDGNNFRREKMRGERERERESCQERGEALLMPLLVMETIFVARRC